MISEPRRHVPADRARPERAPAAGAPSTVPGPSQILALQRTAGNAAVARLLGRSDRAVLHRTTNEFASFADTDLDPRSGLQPGQEEKVQAFVISVEDAIGSWSGQRGTEDLVFHRSGEVDGAFRQFAKATAADPYHDLVWREAARRLKHGMTRAYLKEIAMFNSTQLGDLRDMLGIADPAPAHKYSLQPLWGVEGEGGIYGAKAGFVAKRVLITYENTAIKGFGWSQEVRLTGLAFGLGLKTGAGKLSTEATLTGPAGAEPANDPKQPQAEYLPPAFFGGAKFTSPSAEANANLGPASVKKDLGSALRFSNGRNALVWSPDVKITLFDEVEVTIPGHGGGEEFFENPLAPGAGVEVSNEFGSTQLIGDAEAHGAQHWDELEGDAPMGNEDWVPLHYARIFFETGSAALEPGRDFAVKLPDGPPTATIDRVVDAIYRWDKRHGYRGSRFKVEVSGCHSASWGAYDDELAALEAKREALGELPPSDLRREGDLLARKEMENIALAQRRARNVHEVVALKLDALRNRMTHGVMEGSTLEDPTTHEPRGENPYRNLDSDRSVTILVSYQIFNPLSQVNWNQSGLDLL
jgi:hypothetical protein